MAPKRSKNSALGLIRYNKVVAETRKALKKSGHDISYNEARKYVSNYVYPSLKGVPTYKLHKTVINRKANAIIKHLPPEDVKEIPESENIDFLAADEYTESIEFFELQTKIETAFPPDLNIRINAGAAGITSIFKQKDFHSVIDQWHAILSNIRLLTATQKYPQGASGKVHFSGVLSHIPGRPNNKFVGNYLLDLQLVNSDTQQVYADENPDLEDEIVPGGLKRKLTKGSEAREAKIELKKLLKQKRKEFTEKQKHIQLAKKPTAKQLIELNKQKIKQLELLRKDYEDGIYTKAQYKKEREKINNQYPE